MKRRVRNTILAVLGVTLGVTSPFVASHLLYRYYYPFGSSHCCDLILHGELEEYARNHGGRFPHGEKTPEASLALIALERPNDFAYLLAGKSGDEERTLKSLVEDRTLTPETCGWHYTEGLTLEDDPNLALFWDKEGLEHNCRRLAGGGHIVMFRDGHREHILGKDWERFLTKQREMLIKRNSPANSVK